MNERFNSLFEMLGIDDRYINDKDFSILKKEYDINEIHISNVFLDIINNNRINYAR